MKVALLVFSCLLCDVGAREKPMLFGGESRRDLKFSVIPSWLSSIPFHKGYSLDKCPVNPGHKSCWADSAKAKCVGLNMTTDDIYFKVKAAPDVQTMHDLYRRCAGAAVIKSECTKGHDAILDYEDVRHHCRHLLGSRPRCNFQKAVDEWPAYIITDKPAAVERLKSFGFRNVVPIQPIFAKRQLNMTCEMKRLRGENNWIRHAYTPLGLAYVHRNIYITMAASHRPCAFIFEEDFHMSPHWRERLEMSGIDNFLAGHEAMFLKLDICKKWVNGQLRIFKGPPDGACSRDKVKFSNSQGGPCTDAYLMSAWGACTLARINTPIKFNSDGLMDHNHFREHLPLVKADAIEPQFFDRLNQRPDDYTFHVEEELAWQNMREIPANKRPKFTYSYDGKRIPITWGIFTPLRSQKGLWGLVNSSGNASRPTGC